MRKETKKIKIGNIFIGGDAAVTVQSMTNTNTADAEATVKQIIELEKAGCDIIRCAVPDTAAAQAIPLIKKSITIPLVADIHFDYKLALEAAKGGVDALRINPGNIGGKDKVKAVADMCSFLGIPIRIGVNSGSVKKDILLKYGHPTPEALAESALEQVDTLESLGFYNIVISAKTSNVMDNIETYRILSERCSYPLHIGVTESGTLFSGTVKSSIGIGVLLYQGIGDTIRVSLTDNPVEEVKAGIEILKACNLRDYGIELISCPTCGRTNIDLIGLAKTAEDHLKAVNKNIKVAIMGCAVNGPGEAREADIGIAGGRGEGLIFKKGQIIRKVPENKLLEELLKEIDKL